jgi:hypothetical protein
MESNLPLSAVLSQAYVAFAIEFDNEFEHQAPHRTTNYGSTPGFPKAPRAGIDGHVGQIHAPHSDRRHLGGGSAIASRYLEEGPEHMAHPEDVRQRPEANPHKANKTASLLATISSGKRHLRSSYFVTVEARMKRHNPKRSVCCSSG